MKTHTFSIVVGSAACNAGCPWCVSKMTLSEAPKGDTINWHRFDTACNIVQQARDGLVNVLLTGKGEPMLFPTHISAYLEALDRKNFPLIDLQTNGTLIEKELDKLTHWRDSGLTLVCISIAHWHSDESCRLMKIKDNYNFFESIAQLHDHGLAVRLNCTLMQDGVSNTYGVDHLIESCRMYGVEQLTFREVETSAGGDADVWNHATSQKLIYQEPNWLRNHLIWNKATKLLDLPHGAEVYDYQGQNVCISNCLTSTTDANDIRLSLIHI